LLVYSSPGVSSDVARLQELSQMGPVENPFGLGELLTPNDRSHAKCKIRRMVGRINQQRRYFAVPKRSKSAFDSSILFRAGEIKDTHLHLPQGHLYVAGYRLELGRIGRKEGFGFRQRLRLRPYNQFFGLSCGLHTHLWIYYTHIFVWHENIGLEFDGRIT
jgi:hypothetical protein